MASPKAAVAAPRGGRAHRLIALFRQHRLLTACLFVVLVGGVGVAAFFVLGNRPHGVVVDLGGPLIYQPLPEILTDLKPSAKRAHHIKLVVVAQLPAQQVASLTAKEVEVVAALQARLRELAVADISGAAGVDRLRAIVLDVVNGEIEPAQARAILVTQLLVD